MCHSHQGRFRQQFNFLRRQFLQDGELPFADVLSADIVAQALEDVAVVWNDRIYTPLVTLWVFLGQVLSADHSCLAAVARLIAHRVAHGLFRPHGCLLLGEKAVAGEVLLGGSPFGWSRFGFQG